MNDFYQMMGVCIAVCSIAGGYFQLICRPQLAEITELKNEQHQLIQTYQQALNQARDLRVVYQTAEKRRFDLKLYKSLYFYSKQNVTSAIRSLFRTKQIRIVALQDRDKDAQTALQAMRYKVFFAMNQLALKTT
ncbi:MAG: hypothetical protein KKI20_05190, partial [Gammaproteobacteria bacterium]|nr:hypothetical protein [Gammaproteobacteria bacterium]